MNRAEKIALAKRQVAESGDFVRAKAGLPRLLRCVHLGERLSGQPCGSPLLNCKKHGDATSRFTACSGAARLCASCSDYSTGPNASGPPIATRHLLYHIYPVRGPVWRLGVEQLRLRWPLFTGRKIVAVTTGAGLDPPQAVQDALPADAELLVVPNAPSLREVATWEPMWESVLATAGGGDAVFYAHAKGVTRPFDPGNSCHWWSSLMYSVCLDHWPLVQSVLADYPIAGPFKKVGRGFTGSRSEWHYSGTFFWAKAGDFRGRRWRDIERTWFGNESWPGIAYKPHEAGELFMSGEVPELDVYSPHTWATKIRPMFAEWLKANPPSWPWVKHEV